VVPVGKQEELTLRRVHSRCRMGGVRDQKHGSRGLRRFSSWTREHFSPTGSARAQMGRRRASFWHATRRDRHRLSGLAEQAGERLADVAGPDHRYRHGVLLHSYPLPLDSSKPDQVEAGQRTTDLLHPAAGDEFAEVDREEACVLEKLDHFGLGICVVAGEEDHTLAA
jgi:hypothetical protein